VRGLKWRQRRWLRFPGGVAAAPAVGVDRKQGGWGARSCMRRGENGGGSKKTGRRRAVPILNGARRWGTGRWGGATRRELRRGPGAVVGGGGRPARGPRPMGASGGGIGVPLGRVPAHTGESGPWRVGAATVTGFEFSKPVNFI
jgi:hypothetical protein